MRLYVRRYPDCDLWAFAIITPSGWWGFSKALNRVYLDLGRWRVGRRDDWTPLFTEVHRFGPIQWWTSRSWGKR